MAADNIALLVQKACVNVKDKYDSAQKNTDVLDILAFYEGEIYDIHDKMAMYGFFMANLQNPGMVLIFLILALFWFYYKIIIFHYKISKRFFYLPYKNNKSRQRRRRI